MVSNEYPTQANEPAALTSPKPSSSNKATHGSHTAASTGSSQGNGGSRGDNRDASAGNGQREPWALPKWLGQAPRDEPWRPGSRKA